jgi:hypothetical protein
VAASFPLSHADLVTINVGTSTSTASFIVHTKFLTRCSTYFTKMFNGNFNEAITGISKQEDVTPSAFRLFLDYAYTGQFRHASASLPDLVDLWILANKYLVLDLQTQTANAIKKYNYKKAFAKSFAELDFDKIWGSTKNAVISSWNIGHYAIISRLVIAGH